MKNKESNKKTMDSKLKTIPVQVNPFVYKRPSISDVTIKMIVLLGLQIIMLACTKSFNALLVILVSTAAAVLASVFNWLITKTKLYTNLSLIVQGLLFGMLLPDNYPLLTVFLISFLVLFISKSLFGNAVNAWLNIVCLAVIAAWFVGRNFFPPFLVSADIFTLKNPSHFLIQNGVFPIYEFDSAITGFLNNSIFSLIKVNLPEGFISLLWDTQAAIPAFRFNLLTIIASIILFSDDSFSGLIPGFFLFTYAILVRVFFPLLNGGSINTGDVILALCTSGTLFCAVFMIQWFGTHPMTVMGKIIYGIIAGILAFIIVGCGTSPVGMVYTVLICNIVNLLISVIEERRKEKFITRLMTDGVK